MPTLEDTISLQATTRSGACSECGEPVEWPPGAIRVLCNKCEGAIFQRHQAVETRPPSRELLRAQGGALMYALPDALRRVVHCNPTAYSAMQVAGQQRWSYQKMLEICVEKLCEQDARRVDARTRRNRLMKVR